MSKTETHIEKLDELLSDAPRGAEVGFRKLVVTDKGALRIIAL